MSFGNEDTKATDPRPLGLTMCSDLSFQTQQFGGQRYWAVKDPVALRYFQLRDEEFSILQMIEGNSSLQSLQATFQKQFAPLRIDSTNCECSWGR